MGGPRLFGKETRFIQVDVETTEIGNVRDVAVAVVGDVRTFLEAAMLRRLGNHERPG